MLRSVYTIWVMAMLTTWMVFASYLVFVPSVYAQKSLADAPDLLQQSGEDTGIGAGTDQSDLAKVIASALRLILSLLGTLMLGYMVYAGYLWMTAQGDEGAISTAKGIMINTVIGFLVVVSAWAITYLVQSRFR